MIEKYFMCMVVQIQKQGRDIRELQRKKKMQSLLHPMVLFLLVLIFVILHNIVFSSPVQKSALECCNPLEEDCDKVTINPPPTFRYRR